jgi:L-histidine N-alpha-methyltransferase
VIVPVVTRLDATADLRAEMAEEVRRGLTRQPRELPTRYFYDARGSALFEEITTLPEYYPTRAETAILERHGAEIVTLAQPQAIVELGAGSCAKSRLLIEPAEAGGLRQFLPFDISAAAVEDAVRELAAGFPDLAVHGIVGDFRTQMDAIPRPERRSSSRREDPSHYLTGAPGSQLVLFLGSTIGNFEEPERLEFLRGVREMLRPGDHFLLGVDLVKAERTLHAAYNDGRGVTAAFNLNLLRVLNRELDADFDLDGFEHVAFYDPELQRVEMHLRSLHAQTVRIRAAGLTVAFAAGERVRTEISVKFTRDSAAAALEAAGLALRRWFTDSEERFGLALARPA